MVYSILSILHAVCLQELVQAHDSQIFTINFFLPMHSDD